MPIYIYLCTQCGHSEEVLQDMTAEPKLRCPVCHHWMPRQISAASVQFVGEGWAKTDRKKEAK
jgi:putative FmdB family regulatory protein